MGTSIVVCSFSVYNRRDSGHHKMGRREMTAFVMVNVILFVISAVIHSQDETLTAVLEALFALWGIFILAGMC